MVRAPGVRAESWLEVGRAEDKERRERSVEMAPAVCIWDWLWCGNGFDGKMEMEMVVVKGVWWTGSEWTEASVMLVVMCV
jgi:hypothetical protein